MVTEHDLEKELHKLERAFMELERDLKRKRFTPDQKIKLRTEQRKILIEKQQKIVLLARMIDEKRRELQREYEENTMEYNKINAELQESYAEKKEEENEEARKKKLEEAEVLRKIGESRRRRAA